MQRLPQVCVFWAVPTRGYGNAVDMLSKLYHGRHERIGTQTRRRHVPSECYGTQDSLASMVQRQRHTQKETQTH